MKKLVVSLSVAVFVMAGAIMVPGSCFGKEDVKQVYSEVELSMPEGIDYISGINSMPSGELIVFGSSVDGGTLTKFISDDKGKTWMAGSEYLGMLPVDLSYMEAVESYGYISDDGYVGIFISAYDNDSSDHEISLNYNYLIDPDGNVKELYSPANGNESFYKMYFAGNNVYLENIKGEMVKADIDSGKITGRFMKDTDFMFAEAYTDGDGLCALECEKADLGALDSFDVISAGDKENCYIVDKSGISLYNEKEGRQTVYETDAFDSNIHFRETEKLDDGSLIVDIWDEKKDEEKLIKFMPQQ